MPKRKIAPYWKSIMNDLGVQPLRGVDEVDFATPGTFNQDNNPIAHIPTPDQVRAGSIGLPPYTPVPQISVPYTPVDFEPVPSTSTEPMPSLSRYRSEGFKFHHTILYRPKRRDSTSSVSTPAIFQFDADAEMESPPFKCTRSHTRRQNALSAQANSLVDEMKRLSIHKKDPPKSKIPKLKKGEMGEPAKLPKLKMGTTTRPKRAKKTN